MIVPEGITLYIGRRKFKAGAVIPVNYEDQVSENINSIPSPPPPSPPPEE